MVLTRSQKVLSPKILKEKANATKLVNEIGTRSYRKLLEQQAETENVKESLKNTIVDPPAPASASASAAPPATASASAAPPASASAVPPAPALQIKVETIPPQQLGTSDSTTYVRHNAAKRLNLEILTEKNLRFTIELGRHRFRDMPNILDWMDQLPQETQDEIRVKSAEYIINREARNSMMFMIDHRSITHEIEAVDAWVKAAKKLTHLRNFVKRNPQYIEWFYGIDPTVGALLDNKYVP
jgi:hypothetical protein